MGIDFGPGFHAPAERPVDIGTYNQYIGRWSRLFVPALLTAAEVSAEDHVLDVATGPGEAAAMALSVVGGAGLVVGADISRTMVEAARRRLQHLSFLPVVTDGQALPFKDGCFDAVVCQLGLQFFPDPVRGLSEFRRVLRTGKRAAVCVPSTGDRIPMWGALSDTLSYYFPDQRDALHLTFALADAERLEHMFATAGFSDVLVKRETRRGVVDSFDELLGYHRSWRRHDATGLPRVTGTETSLGAARGRSTAVRICLFARNRNACRDADCHRAIIGQRCLLLLG